MHKLKFHKRLTQVGGMKLQPYLLLQADSVSQISRRRLDLHSRQGWYSTLEGFDRLLGTQNTQASLSLLHSEVNTLI